MKKLVALFATSALALQSTAYAEVLMNWKRLPLPIELKVKQERVIFVDKSVKVGYPQELEGKIRIQSTGGAVYLKALEKFGSARLQLMDINSGEIILLDVQAKSSAQNADEPIRIVYNTPVENQSTSYLQDNHESEDVGNYRPSALPAPAALTRYAAQMFYAPLRTVEPLDGVRQVGHRLPSSLTTLLPALSVKVNPMLAWQLDGYVVTAIKLQNQGNNTVNLDPRDLQGRFYAATFQHNWLGAKGSPEDTTMLYLVTEGYPNQAVIPEGQKYQSKKLKKTTTKTIRVVR